jgi:hypothetical protein
METELSNAIVELDKKTTLGVLCDVVKSSIVLLNAHSQNWPVSDKCFEIILGTASKLTDEIINTTEKNHKLDDVKTSAVMLNLRIDAYLSGTGVMSW